jgi:hypothetical protein
MLTFEDRLTAYLNQVARLVVDQRARKGGIRFGREGSYILLVEATDVALRTEGPRGFLSAAVYALIGAMQTGEHWDDAAALPDQAANGIVDPAEQPTAAANPPTEPSPV